MNRIEQGPKVDESLTTHQVLFLMAFHSSYYNRFCNAIVSSRSIIENYNGEYVGSCREITNLGCGEWSVEQSLAFILFNNLNQALLWINSDPKFRNQDFLDDVEMHIIPLQKEFHKDQTVVQFMNLTVPLEDMLFYDYMASANSIAREQRSYSAIASTYKSKKIRGRRSLFFVLINTFSTMEAFEVFEATVPFTIDKTLSYGDNIIAQLCRPGASPSI